MDSTIYIAIFLLGVVTIAFFSFTGISRSYWTNAVKKERSISNSDYRVFRNIGVIVETRSQFAMVRTVRPFPCNIYISDDEILILTMKYSPRLIQVRVPLRLNKSDEATIEIKMLNWNEVKIIEVPKNSVLIKMKYEIEFSFKESQTKEDFYRELENWR